MKPASYRILGCRILKRRTKWKNRWRENTRRRRKWWWWWKRRGGGIVEGRRIWSRMRLKRRKWKRKRWKRKRVEVEDGREN